MRAIAIASPLAGWLRACIVTHLLCIAAAGGAAAGAPEPRYLLFQFFTAGPGFTTEPGGHVISSLPDPRTLDAFAKSVLDKVGERGDALHRLGITVGPLALDYTDDQIRRLIAQTFELASKYKIAVALHIDDSKFWTNRHDLWSDPANVEWLDWDGTRNTGQYLNWGEPWKLAPQACFNSPRMLEEARRLAAEVIGPAIAGHLAELKTEGDAALFAGVFAGWETAIGRDFATRRDLGFCALSNRGYSKQKPPRDSDAELEAVTRAWIDTWATSLAAAGVPSDRIYSHITFDPRKRDEGSPEAGRGYSKSVMHTPPAVAFGDAHRAGFSTYPDRDRFRDIYAALSSRGNPAWASAEGTNVDFENGPPHVSAEGMEDYLARMFNHGAVAANVFGWEIGEPGNPFREATESDSAIAAYRRFLLGLSLKETPLDQSYRRHPSLFRKLLDLIGR